MLYAGHDGNLELRRESGGAIKFRGTFPYGKTAVLSDGGRTGRPRKEKFAPRAFSYRVEKPGEEIHLLVGHSYDRPLASRNAGTLTLRDTAEALTLDATITPEMQRVSYVMDTIAAFEAGLIVGLSPGFRIPPKRAVKEPETVEEEEIDPENDMHGALIRTVHEALIYEISFVTMPAYKETQIEMRNWNCAVTETFDAGLHRVLNRWRA